MSKFENWKSSNKAVFWGVLGILIIFIVLFFVAPFVFVPKEKLPEAFVNSSVAASAISRDIVALNDSTNKTISTIGALDFSVDGERAIALVGEAEVANNGAYEKAFQLAQELKAIAESMSYVESSASRQIMNEAIATELSLISEFITYTQNLKEFLGSVRALVGDNTEENRIRVNESLRSVNEKAKLVNKLNAEFLSKIKKFDSSL